MRFFIGEHNSDEEIISYIKSIIHKSDDELHELVIENTKALYNYPEDVYNEWRNTYKRCKSGNPDPSDDPAAFTRVNMIAHCTGDKFYIDTDDEYLLKLINITIWDKTI